MPTKSALKVYYDKDIDTQKLLNKKVAIVGYGSQGCAQLLNLRDSCANIVCGLRLGLSCSQKKAETAGLKVMSIENSVKWADVIMMLIPDELHEKVYEDNIKPYLSAGKYLGFSHGFSIHYKQVTPPDNINVFMVSPKGPGPMVRDEYTKNGGLASLIAVYQDPSGDSKDIALAYAGLIGSGRTGIIETTFKEETEADLFGEQAVLCGGVVALIKASFDTLVEAGYSPHMAYIECFHELKLTVDLLQKGGITNMRHAISNTAQYGDLTRGPRIAGNTVKKELKQILSEIQDGSFAKEWIEECKKGKPNFNTLTKADENHLIEKVGSELRSIMAWRN